LRRHAENLDKTGRKTQDAAGGTGNVHSGNVDEEKSKLVGEKEGGASEQDQLSCEQRRESSCRAAAAAATGPNGKLHTGSSYEVGNLGERDGERCPQTEDEKTGSSAKQETGPGALVSRLLLLGKTNFLFERVNQLDTVWYRTVRCIKWISHCLVFEMKFFLF
jgi:hypothetical protein